MLSNIIIILFGIVTAVHLISCVSELPKLRNATKVLLMPLLLVFYLSTAKNISFFVVAGLLFSTIGDIALLKSENPILFLVGIVGFGLAHLSYLFHLFGTVSGELPWVVVAVVVGGIAIAIYWRIKSHIPPKMRLPVIGYAVLIITMAYFSAMRMISDPGILTMVGLLGAVLFVLSDSVLATNLFGIKSKQKDFIVMASYITAQSMLVSSFMF